MIYVISDIHGCLDELQALLKKIGLSDTDRLILAGDYVDRGKQSREMLEWLETKPLNVTAIKGNHDVEYVEYVRLMQRIDKKNELMTDATSNEDAKMLYDTVRYQFKQKSPLGLLYFDYYNTIYDLIEQKGITLGDLIRWADMLEKLPYYERFDVNGRDCVVVHAGFCEDVARLGDDYKGLEDFYLYAREDATDIGGIPHGMVVAGHTPTINEDSRFYNDGEVFRYHDMEKDCTFFDIDCGCVFYEDYPSGTLACLRVDDEEVFYL